MFMENVKLRLDAWRDAQHRRDRLAPGSSEWLGAEDEVRSAATAFHAELAQVTARYAEAEFQRPNPRWSGGADYVIKLARE
jgi:hypothetical protein